MRKLFVSASLWCVLLTSTGAAAEPDWPQWRGASSDSKPRGVTAPLEWSEDTNIRWRTESPGRGHSSPTVVGSQVLLTTADEQDPSQWVLSYDRHTGEQLWRVRAFQDGFDKKAHQRNSQASCSVASNGRQIYAVFLNDAAVWLLCLDLDGQERWRRKVGGFVSFWGYGASPTLYDGSVIVAADHAEGGYLAAYSQDGGELLWRQPRPTQRNYTSPIIHTTSGRDQLIMAGCETIASYNPSTGEPLWRAEATTQECVGTVVVDGDLAFASGGYPKLETAAVRTDGSGEVVWRNRVKIYVPSLLAHKGRLFAVTDEGIAYCWQAETGEEIWKKRLGGVFNTSPVLVGDNVVAVREDGAAFIFSAAGDRYRQVAKNNLGDEVYATPTFCGDAIFLRVAKMDGANRVEYLYCIAKD